MKPKSVIPIFPFLLAIYPLWALLGRNPGEITLDMAIRFTCILSGLALAVMGLLYFATRDYSRTVFLGTLLVWFAGSSGHIYRLLVDYVLRRTYNWLNPVLNLFALLIVLFLAKKNIWQRLKPEKWINGTISYLNFVSGLALAFVCWPIFQFWSTAYDDVPRPWSESFSSESIVFIPPTLLPDIYYIILDGYGRQDILSETFGYDNYQFIDFLRQHGFYVANQARSNYVQTPLSLSSSLNFSYIQFAEEYAGADSNNRIPLFELLRQNRTREFLKIEGYDFIVTSSGYPFTEFTDADVYLSPFLPSLNELERYFLITTSLDPIISKDSALGNFLRYYLPIPSYESNRQRIIFALDEMSRIPKLKSPKFVFVHIIGPHPPFVLDRYGNAVNPNHLYVPSDGEGFGGKPEEYQQQYIEQMVFINKQMEIAIDSILKNSIRPPVILIQGDHGPGSLLVRDSLEHTCLRERTSILSAYYLPESNMVNIYPNITPVNSFRLVFNTYFGTHLKFLPDETFFSPQSWPYDFKNITNQIETTCN